MSNHEACFPGCKENVRRCDFLRSRNSPYRKLCLFPLPPFRVTGTPSGHIGRTGAYAIDEDTFGRDLLGDGGGQGDHRRLRGAVDRRARRRLVRQLGGGIDNAAISPFQHRRQAVPQPEGDAAQVDVEKPLPVLLVQRDEIARRLAMSVVE
nr:hypothetical protein [uncultured Agrobacterium sp.]